MTEMPTYWYYVENQEGDSLFLKVTSSVVPESPLAKVIPA